MNYAFRTGRNYIVGDIKFVVTMVHTDINNRKGQQINMKIIITVVVILFGGSTDLFAQTNWTKYSGNPVLNLGASGSWDDAGVILPSVIFDSNTFKMWYHGDDGSATRIGYATSSDRVTWTKSMSNPVLVLGPSGSWDDASILEPSVLFDGSTYHMWYQGFDGIKRQIGYATSPDGVTWTKSGSNPVLNLGPSGSWDSSELRQPFVILDGELYRMWYTGSNGSIQQFGYATSTDGVSWIRHDGPIMGRGGTGSWDGVWMASPRVLMNGSSYEMIYSAFDGSSVRIGYATSQDGLAWIKYDGNPVLNQGSNGTWDDKFLFVGSVRLDVSTYEMWYGGFDGGTWRIGYATSIVVPVSVQPSEALIETFSLSQNFPNPFNPVTVIEYALPKSGDVSLTIYNLLGEEVTRLVSENQQAGYHKVNLDASSLVSGIYFYRLQAGDFVRTRKMVLLK